MNEDFVIGAAILITMIGIPLGSFYYFLWWASKTEHKRSAEWDRKARETHPEWFD